MLTVFISSNDCKDWPIVQYPCNIVRIQSMVDCDKGYISQPGFKLEIRDITNDEFKNNVWPYLKKKFNLTCAFIIRDHEFMGCIRNWPNVFAKSNCPNNCS